LKSKKEIINEKGEVEEISANANWYENTVMKWLAALDKWYANLLRWCLGHKLVTSLIALAVVIIGFLPVFMGKIGFNFMAQQDNGYMSLKIELQRGTRVEESMRVARQIEADLKSLAPEIKLIASTTGSSDDAGFSALMNQSSNNIITMTVTFPERSQRQRTVFEIAEVFRQYLGNRADVVFSNVSTNMGFGGSGNNNVSVEIYGYDFEATNKVAEEIKNKMKDVKGARNITISRDEDRAELQINFDKEKLALSGLSAAQVANESGWSERRAMLMTGSVVPLNSMRRIFLRVRAMAADPEN